MNQLGDRVKVVKVLPIKEHVVRLTFDNGIEKEINLHKYLRGPIFKKIRKNHNAFLDMHIEGGTICWDNGADIDPDVLYYDLQPAWIEENEKV